MERLELDESTIFKIDGDDPAKGQENRGRGKGPIDTWPMPARRNAVAAGENVVALAKVFVQLPRAPPQRAPALAPALAPAPPPKPAPAPPPKPVPAPAPPPRPAPAPAPPPKPKPKPPPPPPPDDDDMGDSGGEYD